ncbi:hypothetical protein DYB25_001448 [Aphanomyces astaci]|uniref:AAA ATPase AAA+ lid domain-containing protein n=2 Tax=Aphanomyces astaci TaxID=112090 RepID=A0A396ZTU5_APHAT|nr:hypothetical protein DYB25_001448 [Aphanomyces astaci]
MKATCYCHILAHRSEFGVEPPPAADDPADDVDPRLKSCDPELISKIEMEIVDAGDPVSFDDIGATNRPQELDEAARRRFVKRLYIPLPSAEARLDLMNRLLAKNQHDLTDADKSHIVQRSKGLPHHICLGRIRLVFAGFSGADVRSLCTEAGAIVLLVQVVSVKDLQFYMEWNAEFGSYQIDTTEMDDDDAGI